MVLPAHADDQLLQQALKSGALIAGKLDTTRFKTYSAATQVKLNKKIDKTTTVNGHPLSGNVTVTAADVGAAAGSGSSTGTNTGDVSLGTANGLSLAGQILSLQVATNSLPGALAAADHILLSTALQGLTGPITSVGNATSIAAQTGTGSKFVMDTSPTLITPVLGAASGTSLTLAKNNWLNFNSSYGSRPSFGQSDNGSTLLLTVIRSADNYVTGGAGIDFQSFAGASMGRWYDNGRFLIGGLIDLSGASAGQIKFPATQNPSADPNTLDDYSEYTAASTACTGAITTAVVWKATKVGNVVTLTLPPTNGTATATTNFKYGVSLPVSFRPTATLGFITMIVDNGINSATPGLIMVNTLGVITVYKDLTAATNFTAAGTSGLGQSVGISISWTI